MVGVALLPPARSASSLPPAPLVLQSSRALGRPQQILPWVTDVRSREGATAGGRLLGSPCPLGLLQDWAGEGGAEACLRHTGCSLCSALLRADVPAPASGT